jgi:hypothetical protein
MARALHIPELADGGYWYVVPVVQDDDGTRPKLPAHVTGYCAWYADIGGEKVAAVRLAEPAVGIETLDVSVEAVLEGSGYHSKPRGRIGGR